MKTEFLSSLKIHKLTQEQYDRELSAGNIDETALYLTPEEDIDLTPYAKISDLDLKAEIEHEHDAAEITSGILPLTQGGTGQAMSRVQNSIIRFSSGGDYFSSTPTANGAMYATAANGQPQFGVLPVAQGGTGATSAAAARTNLGAISAEDLKNAIAAIPTPDVSGQINTHNTSSDAHSDIRDAIEVIKPFIITCDLGENTGYPMTALINFSHSVEEIFNYMEENATNENLSKSIILRMNDGGAEIVDMYLTSYTASELYFGACIKDMNYTARLGWDGDHYVGIHELLTTYAITNQVSEGDERLPTSIAVYEAIAASKASLNTETWTFTLEDGSTVTKAVYVG